jgi:hypothetical protein
MFDLSGNLPLHIMSFVDELRSSRAGKTPVVHEFLTNYSPRQPRLHAFVEGDDDVVFYKTVLQARVDVRHRIYVYQCAGKANVFAAFDDIVRRFPECRTIMFFVDKDIDDILGRPWPTDPRIFVTDTYSIENYLVSREALMILINNFVQFRDVSFTTDVILEQFDRELERFHKLATPLMALITYAKRSAMRPNLNNVQLRELFVLSIDCRPRVRPGDRLAYFCRAAGIAIPQGAIGRVTEIAQELRRLPPKRYVRGKFEIWFLVEFFKALLAQMESAAREVGGKLKLRSPVEHGNITSTLAGRIQVPEQLDRFLRVNLPAQNGSQRASSSVDASGLLLRLRRIIYKILKF